MENRDLRFAFIFSIRYKTSAFFDFVMTKEVKMLEAFGQKIAELACNKAIQDCPSIFMQQLNCTLQGVSQCFENAAGQAGYNLCQDALRECPRVLFNQYALPVTLTAAAVTAAVAYGCTRPRRR